MDIVIATHNEHKVNEFRHIFRGYDVTFYSMSDLGIPDDAYECGSTYEENSLYKALACQKYTTLPIIADDSGLEVTCLGGIPGIYTARFAKNLGGQHNANLEIINRLNELEKNYEGVNRKAKFTSVITLVNLYEKPISFKGTCHGEILKDEFGKDGFGYDPIFYSYEANTCFGVVDVDTKIKFSHRGKACRDLISFLVKEHYINEPVVPVKLTKKEKEFNRKQRINNLLKNSK